MHSAGLVLIIISHLNRAGTVIDAGAKRLKILVVHRYHKAHLKTCEAVGAASSIEQLPMEVFSRPHTTEGTEVDSNWIASHTQCLKSTESFLTLL